MSRRDLQAMLLLGCSFCFLYAYFFQGGGWNQNSHFDTVRAFVEGHTSDITPIAYNTGDVGLHAGGIYSNKGPGLALWMAPVYFALHRVESVAGVGADFFWTATVNAQILTFFASGLPGVALVLVLFQNFRRQGATTAESLCLASGFGSGSLIFPYAGVMMSHVFSACVLFTAWHIMSRAFAGPWMLFVAGAMTGMAVVTDLISAPIAFLFLGYVVLRHPGHASFGFLVGAVMMAALFLAYNQIEFGSPFQTNQTLESPQFKTPGLLFGVLETPRWERLYWLSFHPYRGLFYCCPVLLLPLLSGLRSPRSWRSSELAWEQGVPWLVVATFVLFNASFNGWTGGWGVGPRYLIPMLPFLFSFALTGFRRWPIPSGLLMAVSAALMFSVAAVQLMVPSSNGGAARAENPVLDAVRSLAAGEVSLSTQSILDPFPESAKPAPWASYNLGEAVGLSGFASVVPAAVSLAALAGACVVFLRRARTAGPD